MFYKQKMFFVRMHVCMLRTRRDANIIDHSNQHHSIQYHTMTMSPHKKKCSRSLQEHDKVAKAKLAMAAAIKSKRAYLQSQQDEKNLQNKILNHAARHVRAEQKRNFGRVGHGFMKSLIGHYHNKGLVWVTANKIQYAVQKMKALERKQIPKKERSHHPVTTIHVRRIRSSSSSSVVSSRQGLSGAEMFDVMMGSSVSDVSSPELSGAEENEVHPAFSSETSSSSSSSTASTSSDSSDSTSSSSSSSSTASTSSDSSDSTDVTDFLKQVQQQEEDQQHDEKYIEQERKRQERYEELERERREMRKRRKGLEEQNRVRRKELEERQRECREQHGQELEEQQRERLEQHRQELEERRKWMAEAEEHRKWMAEAMERMKRIVNSVGTF
jgi:hypothetical protein